MRKILIKMQIRGIFAVYKNKKAWKLNRLQAFLGGEGGIRTLDELSTHTRVPVVRHKPG